MTLSSLNRLSLLSWAFNFYFRNFLSLVSICLIAAMGRIIQFKAFGEISLFSYWTIEIAVEVSRIVFLLLIVGAGDIGIGGKRLRHLIMRGNNFRNSFRKIRSNFQKNWKVILLNFLLFSCFAFLLNMLIKHSAVCIVWADFFKNVNPFQAGSASTQFTFFIKNLTVIPFTLIFELAIFFFLTEKLKPLKPSNI
jgi:hypothetical protein